MRRILIGLIVNALALWVTTSLVPGVEINALDTQNEVFSQVITYLLVALIFAIVNFLLGGILRVLTFPFYVLTLGLFSIVVNAILLSFTAWISGQFGSGLTIDTFFWSGIIGALVFGIANWLIGILLKPIAGKKRK